MNLVKGILYVFVFFSITVYKAVTYEYAITIKHSSSEIQGKEDAMGRLEYEALLTQDPITKKIPARIKDREVRYATSLVQKQQFASRTSQLAYTSLGPLNVGGRTRAVAFDVRNENIILAGGVSGGIWKSTNGGDTWIRKSDPAQLNSVTCLVQDTRPGKEDIWYHGTGELRGNSPSGTGRSAPYRGDGLFKSMDNGETWFPISSTVEGTPNVFNGQFQYIFDIIVNKQNLLQDEIFVAAYGGILRSLDGGETWQNSLGPRFIGLSENVNLNDSSSALFSSVSQSDAGGIYASISVASSNNRRAIDAGYFYSVDGETWIDISYPFEDSFAYDRTVHGHSASDPDLTYFLVQAFQPMILVHRLSKIGESGYVNGFEPNPRILPDFEGNLGGFNTQGSYNMMIKVHPENANVVFTGGTNLYRTVDGFRSADGIDWVGGYNPEGGTSLYPDHHPDQHNLLFYPSNPDKILSASDGGLRISEDGLAENVEWESINNGFITSQFYTIAQTKEAGSVTVLGGMQDNGTDITNRFGASNWRGLVGGDGAFVATTPGQELWFASFQRGQTLRITLNQTLEPTSFARIDPAGLIAKAQSSTLFINPYEVDPSNSNRIFYAGGNTLYVHENVSQIPGGSQAVTDLGWKAVKLDSELQGVISAVSISEDGTRLYFGTSVGELYKVSNANRSSQFQSLKINADILPEGLVSSIGINPENEDHIVLTYSNYNIRSIFESTDGGESFSDISGNLEENQDGSGAGSSIRWCEIVPLENGTQVFVGTSTGLYQTVETSTNTVWQKEAISSIGNAVVTMMDYRAIDGRLVIATHGNGVFETFVDDFRRVIISNSIEDELKLISTYPNPFEVSTDIVFNIPFETTGRVDVFSAKGEFIDTILWARLFAGENRVTWDGTNAAGTTLANGVYFYKVSTSEGELSGRVILRR